MVKQCGCIFIIVPAAVASHLDSCWTSLAADGGWYCGSWNSQSLGPLCPRQGGNAGCLSSTGWWQNCLWWPRSTTPAYGSCITAPLRTGSGRMAYLLDTGPETSSVCDKQNHSHILRLAPLSVRDVIKLGSCFMRPCHMERCKRSADEKTVTFIDHNYAWLLDAAMRKMEKCPLIIISWLGSVDLGRRNRWSSGIILKDCESL